MNKTNLIEYAGFWRRSLAMLIDLLIWYAIAYLLFIFLGLYVFYICQGVECPTIASLSSEAFRLILGCLSAILYYVGGAAMESSFQQATFGKRIVKIVVTDIEGNRISFARSLHRNLEKITSNLTFGLGYFMCAFTRRKQALHDILTECLVIVKD